MGFAVYLKKEFNSLELSAEQQSEVWSNSLIVHMIQIALLGLCFKFAHESSTFNIKPATGLDMMAARFIASMFMHINTERDVRGGISMMKYAVNHHEHFTNVTPAFIIALLLTLCSFLVEINVMLILSSIGDVLNVIMKYVSLCAIAHLPRFYFSSLVANKASKFGSLTLKIHNYRYQNKLKDADWQIKLLRFVYKGWRLFFCSVSYYFMPFMMIFLNF